MGISEINHTHAMPPRIPIRYTFGNHMHWVDMEWLWGYSVLPGSVRDMLRFCEETGAKGCVNFDGVGYEKLASEAPESLADLRASVQAGIVEPVGCSYGQPYGLFQGGESNVRQRVYGVRAVLRLLGARPRVFWEEEFDFFPQLPQILASCGFEFGSLYFQWTWHTPEVPLEVPPAVWWEAPDGSRLLAATRNRWNLHQWPEDFALLLDDLASGDSVPADPLLIQQWLELMPSSDWMCRSELMIPMLRRLLADERFSVQMGTLGEHLDGIRKDVGDERIPVSRYGMEDVWHGMSLGKNGDRMRQVSAAVEQSILEAETLAALLSLFGRPYAQWDVYPVWEIEEAWRELLAAQHHDNDECEGLCGHVGMASYRRALELAAAVRGRQVRAMSRSAGRFPNESLLVNTLGWECARQPFARIGRPLLKGFEVPAMGWVAVRMGVDEPPRLRRRKTRSGYRFSTDSFAVDLITSEDAGCSLDIGGALELGLGDTQCKVGGSICRTSITEEASPDRTSLFVRLGSPDWPNEDWASVTSYLTSSSDGLCQMWVNCHPLEGEPDPGMNAGWQLPFRPRFPVAHIYADYPYGTYEVKPSGIRRRKYPTGDWMTSEQWFEEIENPFTSLSFVDFVGEDGAGVMVIHDGTKQWFLDEGGRVRALLGMVDPWDEDLATASCETLFRIIPHGPITNSERHRQSMRFRADHSRWLSADYDRKSAGLPPSFSALKCSAGNVVQTAFYREDEGYSGRDLEEYAGRGMGYPFVLRLVEFDGIECEAEITLPGPIAAALKTNLLGEPLIALSAEPADPPPGNSPEAAALFEWQKVRVPVRPYEIVTLYLDLVPGRKQPRDLDAKRSVWATVHRAQP